MRAHLIPVALLLVAAVAFGQEKKDPALAEALVKAKALAAEDAVDYLNGLDDLDLAARAYLHLARHHYWKEKDVDDVVTVARGGIRFCLEHAEKAEGDAVARFKGHAKSLAYDLGSFTWPGWGVEGMEILPKHRVAGRKAAKLNLALALELGKGPDKMSYALWLVGAHHLAEGEYSAALKRFGEAREKAVEAKEVAGATMCEGYAAMTLLLGGSRRAEGRKRFDAAVKALEEDGSEDALYYAKQLEDVLRTLSKSAWPLRSRSWKIECGPAVLEIHLSRTAHLFQIVDRLADPAAESHGYYRKAMKPGAEDKRPLARYREIRERSGAGLERVFETPAELDTALFAGVETGHITPDESIALREILLNFAKRVDALLADRWEKLADDVDTMDTVLLAKAAEKLERFCGIESPRVTLFPIAAPDPADSRGPLANGLLYEIGRAFFGARAKEIGRIAASTPGLDDETLVEGLAFAFAFNLQYHGEADPLVADLAERLKRGEGLGVRGTRFRLFGLALRPLLSGAIEKGRLVDILPRAADAWKVLREVQGAWPK